MALEDRLRDLKQDAERDKQAALDMPALIAEWQRAVKSLFTQVREWLSHYEHDGLLAFSEQEIQLTEERAGTYTIDRMELRAGKATIVLQPVARFVFGSSGLVSMHMLGRLIGDENISLRRLTKPGEREERWGIIAPRREPIRGPSAWNRTAEPLTQESLEAAVERLLG